MGTPVTDEAEDRKDLGEFRSAVKKNGMDSAAAALDCLRARWWDKSLGFACEITDDDGLAKRAAEHSWMSLLGLLKRDPPSDDPVAFASFLKDVVESQARDVLDIHEFRKFYYTGQDAAERAFDRLISRWRNRTVSLSMSILREASSAEDAAQLAWLKVYRALKPSGTYDESAPFEPYLAKITRNTASDVLRSRRLFRSKRLLRPRCLERIPAPERPGLSPRSEVLLLCLAELRRSVKAQCKEAGLLELFEVLDIVPPVANEPLGQFVLRVIGAARPVVGVAGSRELVQLEKDVTSKVHQNPACEQKAASALLKRTRMQNHPDPGQNSCCLHDWLERVLSAVCSESWRLWYDWWAYLICEQALAFREPTAGCALYRIVPNTFNAGEDSRWRVRTERVMKCALRKFRQNGQRTGNQSRGDYAYE